MTYKKLYEDALFKLEHNKITLGEFEEMTRPLDREVEQEPIIDKIRAEIIQSIQNGTLKIESGNEELFRIIDKYKAETEEI